MKASRYPKSPKFNTPAKIFLVVLIVLAVGLIFANSVVGKEYSAFLSYGVTAWLKPRLEPLLGKGVVTVAFVRKLAHALEYLGLGLLLGTFFRKITVKPFFFALLVAVVDETIQIYSNRGPLVQDIWLDFIGACLGIFISIGVVSWVKMWRKS